MRAILVVALIATTVACGRTRSVDTVILIVVDTLRADHLGIYGYGRSTSPQLDRLAQDGLVFERAFSSSPWTLPAFGSMLTGRWPEEHSAGTRIGEGRSRRFLRLNETVGTLAEAARLEGFATGAIVNNAFLAPEFGLARGFDDYDFDPGSQARIRRADETVSLAIDWLGEVGDRRSLLLLHLFDPHVTYEAPAPYLGMFSDQVRDTGLSRPTQLRDIATAASAGELDIPFLEARYDEEIRFVDAEIGRLFERLAATDGNRRRLVVLTSDHGEEFLDHGGVEHGHSVYDELIRVPLVIWHPDLEPGRSREPVSLVDLLPTFLGAVGGKLDPMIRGRSLLRPTGAREAPRLLLAGGTLYGPGLSAAIAWPLKLTRDSDGELGLFDLEADPAERRDLAAERSAETARLARRLEAMLAAQPARDPSRAAEPDDDSLESLRSLGYVQ